MPSNGQYRHLGPAAPSEAFVIRIGWTRQIALYYRVQKGFMQTILVIEDDRATRKALTQMFEMEQFTVRSATNGAEGLAMFRSQRPDFVILDLRMPQMR